ncbi:MAG: sulfotransferase, partial [Bacteroidota bacterium]
MRSFFISGVQRSGTTLLATMLGKHPEIDLDGFSVAFRLITCFRNYELVLPDNLEHSREAILSWLIQNDYKGRLAQLLDYEHLDQYTNVRDLLRTSIQRRLDQQQKTVWGDKAPNLQHFATDLFTLLPETKIIHIVRDGRATANSFARRAYKNLYLSAQEWVDGNISGMVCQEWVGKEQLLIIHYEDLLQQPETSIRSVCDFLGLPFHEAMLDLRQGSTPEQEAKQYVKSKFDLKKINQYQTQLTPHQIRKIEQIQGPLLKKLGYTLQFEHSPKAFQQLSIGRRIWLNQKDNLRNLFRK